MPGLSTALVAETPGHTLAARSRHVPIVDLRGCRERRCTSAPGASGTIAVIKVCGVAVAEPARGSGIGTILINACTGLYFQLGYLLAYGQFDAGDGLASYDMRLGFDVHSPGAAISFDERLGLPIGIATTPEEQLFTRWRR